MHNDQSAILTAANTDFIGWFSGSNKDLQGTAAMCPQNQALLNICSFARSGDEDSERIRGPAHSFIRFVHVADYLAARDDDRKILRDE